MFTIDHVKEAILKIAEVKGKDRAALIEKIFRLETGHFKSLQFKICGSPGMEDGKWANLDESKFTKVQMKDNHLTGAKQMRTFLKWNNVFDFCTYLSDYIDRHNGNFARWNSTNPAKQAKYAAEVGKIKSRFIE